MDMIYQLFEILKGIWAFLVMLASIANTSIQVAVETIGNLLGL